MLLTRKLAFGGIATALVLMVVSISYISPTADLALFAISSFFIAMVVIETDFITGFSAYLASGILLTAFFGIYYSGPFLVLFGLYPLLKGLMEKRLKRAMAYLLKAVYFCALVAGTRFIFNETAMLALTKWNQLLPEGFLSAVPSVWILALVTVLILFLYDYALTLMIAFYFKRIRKAVKIK
jgi:hypothetical protein